MKNKTCGGCKIARPSGRQSWMYCPRKHDTVLSEAEQCKTPYMTNGDKVRQMNTSGLIDVIVCPHPGKVCIHRVMNGYACRCCKRDWLNAPAEGEESESKDG